MTSKIEICAQIFTPKTRMSREEVELEHQASGSVTSFSCFFPLVCGKAAKKHLLGVSTFMEMGETVTRPTLTPNSQPTTRHPVSWEPWKSGANGALSQDFLNSKGSEGFQCSLPFHPKT